MGALSANTWLLCVVPSVRSRRCCSFTSNESPKGVQSVQKSRCEAKLWSFFFGGGGG